MGWTNSHLHQFQVGAAVYGTRDPEFRPDILDEWRVRLADVLRKPKDRMVYEYDFGDGWTHDIVLEAVSPAPLRARYPMVLAGKRACPPEDVGGPDGYAHFLEAIRDPRHPEHDDMIAWSGSPFDLDAFDLQDINSAFHGGWRPVSASASNSYEAPGRIRFVTPPVSGTAFGGLSGACAKGPSGVSLDVLQEVLYE